MAKTLILCLDGTSNEFATKNTNVVKVFDMLIKDHPHQKVFYQPGIGTYVSPNFFTPITRRIAKLFDLAFAWYLSAHVRSAYTFLVNHFTSPDDKIILVGFSRGAYTCRALAGLINKIGLLPKDNLDLIPFAWKLYKANDDALAADFKAVSSRSVRIDQVLCFDTVSSVGILGQRHLPFTGSNDMIRVFRHAVSLGERRVKFAQNLWQRTSAGPERNTPELTSNRINKLLQLRGHAPIDPSTAVPATDVKELYFLGDHSDVGGSHELDLAEWDLSHIPLRWIVEEMLQNAQPGSILLDPLKCASYGIPYSIIDEPTQREEAWYTRTAEEAALHDNLTASGIEKVFWWILELSFLKQEFQVPDSTAGQQRWKTTWLPHRGRRRILPVPALVHSSARLRLDSDQGFRDTQARYQGLLHEGVQFVD